MIWFIKHLILTDYTIVFGKTMLILKELKLLVNTRKRYSVQDPDDNLNISIYSIKNNSLSSVTPVPYVPLLLITVHN